MSEATPAGDFPAAKTQAGDDLLAELADDFLRRHRAGERADVDEYAAKHPDLAGRIRELFPAMLAMEQPGLGVTLDVAPPAERVGATIGRYKLLERIGEGGFGVVYMAEQLTPVRRKVALKVIKPGIDTRQVIARFEAERQALALMDHESIAKVLDAGATDSGRPYFVMELVHGVPITDYCDTNQLPPRERLELFVPVCRAVQHAHTKGVIHRDLKPTNVLVTLHEGVPVPKVIDFGVAKATGQQLTDKTLFTQFAQMVGTPLYMSPEQAEMAGVDVDTRSDVYSLGVLLYELLTGTTPVDRDRLKKAALDEVRRIIREEDPPRPSTRLSTMGEAARRTVSARRRSDPRRLGQLFRGELDWIVMKALEKDRGRRYETATGLARDVERYLRDEPVEACPPSTGYRLRKFVRRNKRPVLAAAVVLLTLVGGIVGTTLGLVRAEQARRATAERAKSELRARQEAQQREAETKAVLDFVERKMFAAARPGADPRNPGHDETLLKLLEETLALRKARHGPDHPDTLACMRNLAFSYRDRGHRHCAAGRLAEAVADFDRAMELEPGDSWHWYGAAALYLYAGDLQRYRAACRQILDRSETPSVEYPQFAERAAKTCALAPGAVPDFARVERLALRGVTGTERHEWFRNFVLAKALTDYRGGRYAQAVEGLTRFAPKAGDAPWDATAFAALAMAQHRLGHAEQARASLVSARGVIAAKPQDWMRGDYWFDWMHGETLCREAEGLVGTLLPTELTAARRRQWERELADLTRDVDRHPGSPNALGTRARWLLAHGRFEEADRDYERLLQLHPIDHWHWYRRGSLLAYLGREEQYREHSRAMPARFPFDDDPLVLHRITRVRLLLPPGGARGTPQRGVQEGVQVNLEELARGAERAHQLQPGTTWAVLLKGLAEHRAGRHEAAAEWLGKYHQLERGNWPAGAVATDAFLALACHRLGRQKDARDALGRASRRAADLPAADSGLLEVPGVTGGPEDWLFARAALREAEEAVLGRPSAPPPPATNQASGLPVPPLPQLPSGPSPFRGSAAELPGVVQAEDFDGGGQGLAYHDTTYEDLGAQKASPRYRIESVDLEDCADDGGGLNVCWVVPGEWLAYTVDVKEAGAYDLHLRLWSAGGGKVQVQFGAEGGGGPVDVPLTVPMTGWANWTTVTARGVRLNAGRQVMRVTFLAATGQPYVCNANWIEARHSP